jgi:hypothetical protein
MYASIILCLNLINKVHQTPNNLSFIQLSFFLSPFQVPFFHPQQIASPTTSQKATTICKVESLSKEVSSSF